MIAAQNNHLKDLPREFYHDSIFKNIFGCTVAMHAAMSGNI